MDWQVEAAQALTDLLDLGKSSNRGKEWKSLGLAEESDESGWLRLDLRGDNRASADSFQNLCFSGDVAPNSAVSYPVSVTRFADGLLHLKVPDHLPIHIRRVWNLRPPPRFITTQLRDGLKGLARGSLADRLAAGRLDPLSRRVGTRPTGFLDGQWDAYSACFAPGVRLVWGPPGTGKTRVLARAIEDLIQSGQRVLLVSTANIAVDNALLAVVRDLRPAPGQVVRLGTPHLPELTDNENVTLDRLTSKVTTEVDHELAEVRAAIAEFSDADQEIARLMDEVGDYRPWEYAQASKRVFNARQLSSLKEQVATAMVDRDRLKAAADEAITRRTLVEREARAAEPARRALAQAVEFENEIRNIEATRISSRRALITAQGKVTEARTRRGRKSASKEFEALQRETSNYEHQADARANWLRDQIRACERQAHPVTKPEIDRLGGRLSWAHTAVNAALEKVKQAESGINRLREQIAGVTAGGIAHTADYEFVAAAERQDLPAKYQQLERLRGRQRDQAGEQGRLEDKHRRLLERAERLRRDAQREILDSAMVVATTLARSRVFPGVDKQEFDVVLIDEVGAAPLADVLLATSWAKKSAVLLGDFLQLGPIKHEGTERIPHAERELVRKWVNSDVFSHCGIRQGEDAVREPGCVALNYQFRFGPKLCEFANDVIYRDLRPGYEATGGRPPEDTEIVLVDTDSLPEMAETRRTSQPGQWWPIGAVLARALAEHHLVAGDSGDAGVGIVAPYRVQVEATLATLRDTGNAITAAVGTVHAMQGREFDTVIFDLVEDHLVSRGWMADADIGGNEYARDGVRLFGVAITRAKHRLYLLGSWQAIQRATAGPLTVVSRLVKERKIRRVRAAVLLGLGELPEETPTPVSSLEEELRDVLRELVRVDHIYDEITFERVLREHLAKAERSVWMWAPWVGVNGQATISVIAEIVQRGISVTVFVRDDHAIRESQDKQDRLDKLRATGANVVQAEMEHRKLIVVDEEHVLIGSFNSLSHTVGREVMVSLRGHTFAAHILETLRAREFSKPPWCSGCDRAYVAHRVQGKKRGQGPWFWRCPGCKIEQDIDAGRPKKKAFKVSR